MSEFVPKMQDTEFALRDILKELSGEDPCTYQCARYCVHKKAANVISKLSELVKKTSDERYRLKRVLERIGYWNKDIERLAKGYP